MLPSEKIINDEKKRFFFGGGEGGGWRYRGFSPERGEGVVFYTYKM